MKDILFTQFFREYIMSDRGKNIKYKNLIRASITSIMREELNKNNKIIK